MEYAHDDGNSVITLELENGRPVLYISQYGQLILTLPAAKALTLEQFTPLHLQVFSNYGNAWVDIPVTSCCMNVAV